MALEGSFSEYSDFALVGRIAFEPSLTRCCTPKKGELLFGEANWNAGSRKRANRSFRVQCIAIAGTWSPHLCRWLPRDFGRLSSRRLHGYLKDDSRIADGIFIRVSG
jgi:hypothetical protein